MRGELTSAVRAEAVRAKGSAAAALPWVGILLAGISAAGILITPENQERAALLWQTLYVTGMAAPLMTLLAGVTTARETTARDGGTLWRATNPRTIIVAPRPSSGIRAVPIEVLTFSAVCSPISRL